MVFNSNSVPSVFAVWELQLGQASFSFLHDNSIYRVLDNDGVYGFYGLWPPTERMAAYMFDVAASKHDFSKSDEIEDKQEESFYGEARKFLWFCFEQNLSRKAFRRDW